MATEVATARTLDVTGFGEVRARPDIAIVQLAVLTEAKTATEAVQQNAQLAQQVVQQIMALGVPEKDIQTTGLNVYPVLRFDEQQNRSFIDGFRAENSVSATVPVDMAGRVFDAGIQAGANVSSGITFALRDESPYRVAALEEAVSTARRDAETVVRALGGVTLLGPQDIDIQQELGGIYRRTAALQKEGADTPVLPGELIVSARVSIRYLIDVAR